MADEKKERAFNCLKEMEMPKLGFDAVAAVQAQASGGHGGPESNVCPSCTAMVMLHAAAAAICAAEATTEEDKISRDEFARLALHVYDAHKGLQPDRLERMRIIYANAVMRGMFERGLRASVQQAAAAAITAAIPPTPKEKIN